MIIVGTMEKIIKMIKENNGIITNTDRYYTCADYEKCGKAYK